MRNNLSCLVSISHNPWLDSNFWHGEAILMHIWCSLIHKFGNWNLRLYDSLHPGRFRGHQFKSFSTDIDFNSRIFEYSISVLYRSSFSKVVFRSSIILFTDSLLIEVQHKLSSLILLHLIKKFIEPSVIYIIEYVAIFFIWI